MHVKDFVTNYNAWKQNESVFIEASTGMGKTTFVLEQLVKDAKKEGKEVLFLSNRHLLKEQVKHAVAKQQGIPDVDAEWLESVDEFDGITVMSYQKVQKLREANNATRYLNPMRYKYTVFDEAHYIVEDAMFNPHILYLLQYIRETTNVKIFMSATLEEVKEYLIGSGILGKIIPHTNVRVDNVTQTEMLDGVVFRCVGVPRFIWKYSLPQKRRKLDVRYFENFSQIVDLINMSEEKWLIFVSNKKYVDEWKREIKKDVDVIYADHKEKHIVDQIVMNERFEKQVLITTKLLDNGINFKDPRLCNIVIDTVSRVEFIQMLGRKRILGDETLHTFIPKKNLKYFSSFYNMSVRKMIEKTSGNNTSEDLLKECFEEYSSYEMIRRFYIVQDGSLMLNPAGAYKLKLLAKFLCEMQKALLCDEWAFVKEQLSWIDMQDSFVVSNMLPDFRKEKMREDIKKYLEERTGKWMDKSEQCIFRRNISELFWNIGLCEKKGNRVPGKLIIEKMLKAEFPCYKLEVKKSSRKGEVSLWRIVVNGDDLGY